MTCIRCKSCGVTPGKTWDLAWNHEEDLCPDCTLLHNKGTILNMKSYVQVKSVKGMNEIC